MTGGFDMGQMPLLQDLAPFAELGPIARELSVELTLYGGSASRAAMCLFYRPGDRFDIFDLTPFSSDIDLAHTGDKSKTPEVRAAIFDGVPFASWCRWSIADAASYDEARRNTLQGVQVPLRQLRFSTNRKEAWPEVVLADLAARRVSWGRLPDFDKTSYAQQHSTLEIFGLFMALNVVADMEEIAGDAKLAEEADSLKWLSSDEALAEADLARELAGDPKAARLIARAWHLVAVRRARGWTGIWDELLARWLMRAESGLTDEEALLPAPGTATGVSKLTGSGEMRVLRREFAVLTGPAAEQWTDARLAEIARLLDLEVVPAIDPLYRVAAVVPGVQVVATPVGQEFAEVDSGAFASYPEGEFMHLAWPVEVGPQPDVLTGFYLPAGNDTATVGRLMASQTTLAVGGRFPGGNCWLRVDIEELSRCEGVTAAQTTIDVVALTPRSAGELEEPFAGRALPEGFELSEPENESPGFSGEAAL